LKKASKTDMECPVLELTCFEFNQIVCNVFCRGYESKNSFISDYGIKCKIDNILKNSRTKKNEMTKLIKAVKTADWIDWNENEISAETCGRIFDIIIENLSWGEIYMDNYEGNVNLDKLYYMLMEDCEESSKDEPEIVYLRWSNALMKQKNLVKEIRHIIKTNSKLVCYFNPCDGEKNLRIIFLENETPSGLIVI